MGGALQVKQEYIKSQTPQAEFTHLLKSNSQDLVQQFKWADKLVKEEDYRPKFVEFCQKSDLPLDPEVLISIYQESAAFTSEIYQQLYPRPENFDDSSPDPQIYQPPYHNLDHAHITGITGFKILLGGLSLLRQVHPDMAILQDSEKLPKLLYTFCLAANLHELDDWWSKNCPGDGSDDNQQLESAKQILSQKMIELGLSSRDFNYFSLLDNFSEPQEVSYKKSIDLLPNQGFIPDNDVPSIIDSLDSHEKQILLAYSSWSLCSADYLQTINPAYLQPLLFTDPQGEEYYTNVGPMALALEMRLMRPNALVPPGWNEPENDNIAYENVYLKSSFFRKIAFPRINSGLYLLQRFNHVEATNARQVIASKIEALDKNQF